MPKYIITSKAGRTVAGQRNHGVGTSLELTEAAAAAALEAGELRQPGSGDAQAPSKAEKAAAAKAAKAAEGGSNA